MPLGFGVVGRFDEARVPAAPQGPGSCAIGMAASAGVDAG
jgi:hypothetical protein